MLIWPRVNLGRRTRIQRDKLNLRRSLEVMQKLLIFFNFFTIIKKLLIKFFISLKKFDLKILKIL